MAKKSVKKKHHYKKKVHHHKRGKSMPVMHGAPTGRRTRRSLEGFKTMNPQNVRGKKSIFPRAGFMDYGFTGHDKVYASQKFFPASQDRFRYNRVTNPHGRMKVDNGGVGY